VAELVALTKLRDRLKQGQLLNQESDRLYQSGDATRLAAVAQGTRPRIDRTHVLRLAAIAEQASAVATVLDHVKQQTGRRPEWRQDDFGRRLLHGLTDLQSTAERLAQKSEGATDDPDLARTLHIELMRRYVKQFTAAYMYGPPQAPAQARTPEGPRTGGPSVPGSQATRSLQQGRQRDGGTAGGRPGANPRRERQEASTATSTTDVPDVDRAATIGAEAAPPHLETASAPESDPAEAMPAGGEGASTDRTAIDHNANITAPAAAGHPVPDASATTPGTQSAESVAVTTSERTGLPTGGDQPASQPES